MQICPTCREENSDRARFCQGCATPLAPAAAPTEERKVVSVLFVDLVDFTGRAERLDPEDVRAILGQYFERVRSEIERFGGTVEKFIGDAVMAVFGAPVAHGDDAERAVRAALGVLDTLLQMNEAQLGLDLRARLAVNTGEAIVALGARPGQGEALVAGDVVNTAARLQTAAPVNHIVVGEKTYANTRSVIDYRPLDPVQAKGKAAPVGAWLVVAPRAPVGERAFSDVPLIGRGAELGTLRGIWEQVTEQRRPHLVTVFGPTGIGKSRLAHELAQRVVATGGRFLRGRSLPYGESSPYGAFAQIVKQVAGVFDNDPLSNAMDKLKAAIIDLAPGESAEEAASHLAMLVGLRTEDSMVSDRETLFFSARVLVEALAVRQPAMLVFEDIHWADASLLDLIESLGARADGVPLLLLTLARPELLSRRRAWAGGLRGYTSLPLEPLAGAESIELTNRLLSLHGLQEPSHRTEALATISEGNPLFMEELAASLAEGATADPTSVPMSIRGIVDARLDALPAEERAVLMDAAVVGKVFWRGALARLARQGRPHPESPERNGLSAVLGLLEQRGLIRREVVSRIRGDHQFSFKHVLIRDVAYLTLPRAERRQRHAAVAEYLEEATPELGDAAAVLAHHWKEAGQAKRALSYVIAAAEQAGRGWAKERAVHLYQEALGMIREEDAALRREILRKLAVAAQTAWHTTDAERLRARPGQTPPD